MDPSHYERHQQLIPLEAIENKQILLIGCGSLGTLIARLLARLGVTRFHLIDPAAVTPAHLNRAAFSEHQIGHNKAAALNAVLTEIHKRVRCITTAREFKTDHLTQGREDAIVVTTSDPRLPNRVIDGVSNWPREERPVLLVARHAGLTGGYWLSDLETDENVNWPSDLPWLSLTDPPEPAKEARLATTAHFAASIATQALIDHLIARDGSPQTATSFLPVIKRRVDFDLGQIVHESPG